MSQPQADPADLGALAHHAAELAHAFASLACDVALVLDGDGRITTITHHESRSLATAAQGWEGRLLVDTVGLETRHKIEALLAEVTAKGLARRREVNLPLAPGAPLSETIPVAYTALRLGADGPVLAVGHDLRAVARMQQRFVRVQQELERGYVAAIVARPDPAQAVPGLDEAPLDEASRAAFAAWLRAERPPGDAVPPPRDAGKDPDPHH